MRTLDIDPTQLLAIFDWPATLALVAVGVFLGSVMTSRLLTARFPGGAITLTLHLLAAFTAYFAFVSTVRLFTQAAGVAERTFGTWLESVMFCVGMGAGIRLAAIVRARVAVPQGLFVLERSRDIEERAAIVAAALEETARTTAATLAQQGGERGTAALERTAAATERIAEHSTRPATER